MASLVCVVAVIISVAGVQSLDREWKPELLTLTDSFKMASSFECAKALASCVLPLGLDYFLIETDLPNVLKQMRNIEIEDHCGNIRELLNCFDQRVGKGTCADMEPTVVVQWRTSSPLYSEFFNHVCQQQVKEFSRHYRCILTEEVVVTIPKECIKTGHSYKKTKRPSEFVQCCLEAVERVCGPEASTIMQELMLFTAKTLVDAAATEVQGSIHLNAELENLIENRIIDDLAAKFQSQIISLIFHHDPEYMEEIISQVLGFYISEPILSILRQNPEYEDDIVGLIAREYKSEFINLLLGQNPESEDNINDQVVVEYESASNDSETKDEL